jgi:hypothetical protein
MLRKRRSILIGLTLLLFVAIGLLTPKLSSNQSLSKTSNSISFNGETELHSQDMQESEFEEYQKPTYFNIFNFIFSFLPIKPNDKE